MLVPSYLLFLLFTVQVAYSYTVVLESGKRIQGALVSDQESTIVIKDSGGVLLSFKKSILDLAAMSLANDTHRPAILSEVRTNRKHLTLVDIAEETKKRRTGKAKTIGIEDLDQEASFSVMGSETEPISISAPKTASNDNTWQAKLLPLKKDVNRLREKYIVSEASCEVAQQKQYVARTTPTHKPVDLMATYKETPQCRKKIEIENQLQEAEKRLEDMREEARRAGVSWQSLE